MSEEFDREAERERLRRQLEEEEEDRKATQQMSELLLKGATMTNRHCDQCGDPIFRYQGQAFCPTCQRTVAGGGGDTQAAADQDAPSAESDETGEGEDGSAEAPARTPETGRTATDRAGQASPSAQGSSPEPAATGDLGEVRASLVRKLSTLAHQAEATDDVGRSRNILAAAREAAEAIAALDNARR